ncbi:MAG: atpD, partial [Bacilli bacterium]|nr:atpD [Bacilli bacterium]
MNSGRVVSIQGPVVDVQFAPETLPELHNALKIISVSKEPGKPDFNLTLEVSLQLGDDIVRTIAMSTTDGLVRGMEVVDTGEPITVPVGQGTLGRIFSVTGDAIDDAGEVKADVRWPIHREAPDYAELTTKIEIFETGIKVIDLLAPYIKGGKVGLFGGAGVGKTVLIQE